MKIALGSRAALRPCKLYLLHLRRPSLCAVVRSLKTRLRATLDFGTSEPPLRHVQLQAKCTQIANPRPGSASGTTTRVLKVRYNGRRCGVRARSPCAARDRDLAIPLATALFKLSVKRTAMNKRQRQRVARKYHLSVKPRNRAFHMKNAKLNVNVKLRQKATISFYSL